MDPKVHLRLNWGSEGFEGSQVAASRTENLEVVVEHSCTGVPCTAEGWALPHHYQLTRQLPNRNFNLLQLKS